MRGGRGVERKSPACNLCFFALFLPAAALAANTIIAHTRQRKGLQFSAASGTGEGGELGGWADLGQLLFFVIKKGTQTTLCRKKKQRIVRIDI